MPKQTTLFQSWGNTSKERTAGGQPSFQDQQPSTSKHSDDDLINLCDSFDEDDDILFVAEDTLNLDTTKSCSTRNADESTTKGDESGLVSKDRCTNVHGTKTFQQSKLFSQTESKHHDQEERDYESNAHSHMPKINQEEHDTDICDISLGADNIVPTQTQSTNCPGFDKFAGRNWIYPTNYPVRDYQYNIVHQALYKNTMVTLPTGLGKTFIAAVLMYNFYRWYPQGKIVFMAPTKPLVAQQIEACYDIMGIPQSHMAEMTGSMGPPKREKAWREKRVFFLTPQVITNDLSRGSCPAAEIKCLVIDEAHKALGNHAYCQVIRELVKYSEVFRVLALSATPGSDIKAVQQVLNNLLISHIELRTEESIDIKQYSHERKVEKVVVPLGEELTKVKDKYIHILEGIVRKLKSYGVLYNREATSLSKFLILKAREAFRQNPPERLQRHQYGMVEGDFALAMSLYHGYELLQLHGSKSLYNFLDGILTGNKGFGRTRTELTRNGNFNELMDMLNSKYGETQSNATTGPQVVGHPKMERLQAIVLEHFTRFKENNSATRVMIFSQFRDSVQEITDVLNVHQPLVKVMNFIGQSSAGKATKGFTQKEQLQVMKKFRDGGYNTLVSTCVGEEGLDIGDVDLIICFDAHKSPIRLVQRMGRTGRKREGRIVMLVTQGKEEQIYNQSQYSKKSIHKAILNGARSLHFYQHSPRMVPESITPVVHKMHITLKDVFKPTKKLTAGKSNKTGLSNWTKASSNKPETKTDLTLEEYQELQEWMIKEPEKVPKLPSVDLVCLPRRRLEKRQEEAEPCHTVSLCDWTPWQTTLQETHRIGHGMPARHLVELMEFMEIQHSLEPGDDPYGLEMAAYLNKEDVIPEAEERPKSIDRFFNQAPKETKADSECMKVTKKKTVRHHESLPKFEESSDNDSDTDLPDFIIRRTETETVVKVSEKDPLGKDQNQTTRTIDDGNVAAKEVDPEAVMEISDEEIVENNNDRSDKINLVTEREKKKSKGKKSVGSKSKATHRKSMREKHQKHKDAKLQMKIINFTIDDDIDDFDNALPDITTCASINPCSDVKTGNTELMDMAAECRSSDKREQDIDRAKLVGTPPPLEEAVALCSKINEADFVNLNIVEIVAEWNREHEKEQCQVMSILGKDTDCLLEDSEGNSCIKTTCSTTEEQISDRNPDTGELSNVAADAACILTTEDQNDLLITVKIGDTNSDRDHISDFKKSAQVVSNEFINDNDSLHCVNQDAELVCSGKFDIGNVFSGSDSNFEDEITDGIDVQSNVGEKSDSVLSITTSVRKASSLSDSLILDDNDEQLMGQAENLTPNAETETQITFTQALACVHSGSKSVKKTHQSFSSRAKSKMSNEALDENFTVDDKMNDINRSKPNFQACDEYLSDSLKNASNDLFEEEVIAPEHVDKDVYSATPQQRDSISSDDLDMPEFDLGFNLDDDIIPPTPKASQTSQHKLSQMHAKSIIQGPGTIVCNSEWQSAESTTVGKTENRYDRTEPGNKQTVKCRRSLNLSKDHLFKSSENVHDSSTLILSIDKCSSVIPSKEINDKFVSSTSTTNALHNFTSPQVSPSQVAADTRLPSGTLNVSAHYKNNTSFADVYGNSRVGDMSSTAHDGTEHASRPSDGKSNTDSALEASFCLISDVFDDWSDTEDPAPMEESDKTTADAMKAGFAVVKITPDVGRKTHQEVSVTDNSELHSVNESRSDHSGNLLPQIPTRQSQLPSAIGDEGTPTRLTLKTNVVKKQSESKLNEANRNSCRNDHGKLSRKTLSTKKNKAHIKHRKSEFHINDISFDSSFDVDLSKIKTPCQKRREEKCSTPKVSEEWKPENAGSENFYSFVDEYIEDAAAAEIIKSSKKPCSLSPSQVVEVGDTIGDSSLSNDDSFVKVKKKKTALLELSETDSDEAGDEASVQLPFHDIQSNQSSNDSTDGHAEWAARKKKTHKYVSSSEEIDFEKSPCIFGKPLDKSSFNGVESTQEDSDGFDFEKDVSLFGNSVKIRTPQMKWSFHGDGKKQKDVKTNKVCTKMSNSFAYPSDDDDFDDCFISKRKKEKHVMHSKKRTVEKQSTKCFKAKRKKKLDFIDEEAVLSDHDGESVSGDEMEDSEDDSYDNSFIHDSQFSQSQVVDQTEMQAVYLESVKSPPVANLGYKLKYDYKKANVFSQRPQPDDESQYIEDSFCVGSEEEIEEEEPLNEIEEELIAGTDVTVLSSNKKRDRSKATLQTGRQREIHYGRKKALEMIKAKRSGKFPGYLKDKQLKNDCEDRIKHRGRIDLHQDTSSDEEGILNVSVSPMLASVQHCIKKKQKRLLSSDEEEDDCFLELKKHKKKIVKARRAVIDEADDSIQLHSDSGLSVCDDNVPINNLQKCDVFTMIRNQKTYSENIFKSKAGTEDKTNSLKEERLKLQKLKQEEFRKRMNQRSNMDKKESDTIAKLNNNNDIQECTIASITKVQNLPTNAEETMSTTSTDILFEIGEKTFDENFNKPPSGEKIGQESSVCISPIVAHSPSSSKLVILVDTREISGSQDVISDLRFKHGVHVSAAQMPGCDYVVSNRMAVDRKQWSEFSNGANRTKLIERMQHLQELYDRSCIIVEKDRIKSGEEKSARPVHLTKYSERTLALLLRSHVKVFFTDSQAETATLLTDLCKLEERKKMNITAKVDLSEQETNQVKFYASLPKISYVHALNLCAEFRSVSEFLKSSAAVIERKGHMSGARALEVYKYVHRAFDSNFLPTSHK